MCEDAPYCGYCGVTENPEYYTGAGSGEDDLADYNANEADDYRNEGSDDGGDDGVTVEDSPEGVEDSPEGGEDAYLDGSYEDRNEMGGE